MQRDGHIRLLPLHVANKIAAGEVVERPASVLKELMENALDAGATRIEVTIVAGGRTLVSVRDDGCGMTREDALLSLERQATSKIRDVDDIERIDTLGFRGEAIPSIASVSRFTLTTRRAEDEGGTRLVVNAGVLAEVKDCGAPAGTCVEVRDLFCNVPARRKFLRAFATEESHIRATFTVHALAHPDVGFTLILDGRETYRFAPGATLEERIRELFGADFAESLIPVETASEGSASHASDVKVHGYIERPTAGPTLRRDQFIFVNGRPATSAAITYALREAYPRNRDEARPMLVLFIDLPPTQVDVNVHPAKREVRFRRPADVREALIEAVSHALNPESIPPAPAATPLTPTSSVPQASAGVPTQPTFVAPFSTPVIQRTFELPHQPPRIPGTDPTPNEGTVPASTTGSVPTSTTGSVPTSPAGSVPSGGSVPTAPEGSVPMAPEGSVPTEGTVPNGCVHGSSTTKLWRWYNFLAQTSTGLLILETDAGLVLLDPRAARARIAYEKILERREAISQTLLIPETVQLPPADSSRIRSFQNELAAAGFVLEEFGRDTWKVDAVPDLLAGGSTETLLASIASDIAEGGAKRGSTRWRDELIAKAVAKSFAGTSTKLTREAAIQLVNELADARMPYVCPRGKPIMIYKSNRELDRSFGR